MFLLANLTNRMGKTKWYEYGEEGDTFFIFLLYCYVYIMSSSSKTCFETSPQIMQSLFLRVPILL